MSNERYFENAEEKKNRSDRCSKNCRYRDEVSGKCAHETCLLEELPPIQQPNLATHCQICGKGITVSSTGFDNNRICSTCISKIAELVANKENILTHIQHPY